MTGQRYGHAVRKALATCLMLGMSVSAVLIGGSTPVSAGVPRAQPRHPAEAVPAHVRRPRGETREHAGPATAAAHRARHAPSSRKGRRAAKAVRVSSAQLRTRKKPFNPTVPVITGQTADCSGVKVCNVIQRIIFIMPRNLRKYQRYATKAAKKQKTRTPRLPLLPHRLAEALAASPGEHASSRSDDQGAAPPARAEPSAPPHGAAAGER